MAKADRVLRPPCAGRVVRWIRVVPEPGVLLLCTACHTRLSEIADARASDRDVDARLLGSAQKRDGETWRTGNTVYWFHNPPWTRAPSCHPSGA